MRDNGFYTQLRRLMLPIAFQNFMLAAVGAGDSAMLGLVSQDAMAAVSLASNVEFLENLFLAALVCGATILTAQYEGRGDRQATRQVFALLLRWALPIGALFCAAALAVPGRLMALFTDEAALLPLGADYIRIAAGAYLFTGITQCYLCILKTTGHARASAAISSFALALDTVLNLIFIFVFRMGAAGAALTTTLSRLVELGLAAAYAHRHAITPAAGARPSPQLRRDLLRYSLPHLVNSLVWGLGTTLYAVILGHLGTAIAAANSVASLVRKLAIALCRGLGQGGEILLAGVLGAGDLEKGRLYGRRLARLSVPCGAACAGITLLLGPAVSHFMTLSAEARYDLRVMTVISALYMLPQCINVIVVCGVFSAGGDVRFDAYSVAVTMWLVILPLAGAAAFWWRWPPLAVYGILSLDEAVKVPWVWLHYKKYKWLRCIAQKEEAL